MLPHPTLTGEIRDVLRRAERRKSRIPLRGRRLAMLTAPPTRLNLAESRETEGNTKGLEQAPWLLKRLRGELGVAHGLKQFFDKCGAAKKLHQHALCGDLDQATRRADPKQSGHRHMGIE